MLLSHHQPEFSPNLAANLANFLQADVFSYTYICWFYFLLKVQQELSFQTTDRAILVVVFKENLNTRKFKQSLVQSCMQGCNPETSKT
jgi:hypothetical protein